MVSVFDRFLESMATPLMLLCCLALYWVAGSVALLSDDLLSIELSNRKSSRGSSTDLAKIISESSVAINAEESKVLDSIGLSDGQRATFACNIATLLFADQVFTSTSSQYLLEKDVNW